MSFHHRTIGTVASTNTVNVSELLENVTLTTVGVALSRGIGGAVSLSFTCGLTPPGDQDVQVYQTLISGIISPGDGMVWSGSIRLRSQMFIVLNYVSSFPVFIYLTYGTTS
jgi:hypothetical protein